MRHQVPQFIEVKDKIFGPLTFKQFVYLVGAGGFLFLSIRMLPLFIALIVALPVVALGLALAFYKVNGMPFIFTLEAAFKYFIGGKLYIWKKETKEKEKEAEKKETQVYIPKLSSSKLSDLSWGLDIKEKIEESKEN
jgi:hypothetical protein|tara:strand:- start:693 stop:1103 length:411 start_codon:yes stop_codon:yes gene_type:complete